MVIFVQGSFDSIAGKNICMYIHKNDLGERNKVAVSGKPHLNWILKSSTTISTGSAFQGKNTPISKEDAWKLALV